MRKLIVCFIASLFAGAGALAADADVDLRGLDTLGGEYTGKAKVTLKESNLSEGPKLDLSNPLLADTLGTAGNKDQGLCSSSAGGCDGLVGAPLIGGDTLK